MLWSLGKIALFLAAVTALAVGAGILSEQGSSIRIWAFDTEYTLGPVVAVFALLALLLLMWLVLKLIGLIVATFRFLNGDETALSRYFDRNRERRGYVALSEGMIALASGEPLTAMARARTAERLLQKPELTRLLTAQAAEAAGDSRAATEAWKSLLGDEQTRFVAIRGLLQQKLALGDTATALKLAEQAFALKPKHAETQDILLKLQAEDGNWQGARDVLSQKLRSGELPRSVYRRRDALLALQEAKTILDEGSTIEAREAAIEANKRSSDLIPAAAIAARALVEKSDKKGATRVLKKAWEAQPHPDLAAAFAAIEPEETAEQRLKRFQALFNAQRDHEESRLTKAELLLAAEDFPAAKASLGDLVETHPTQRALAILAAAERGMGAPDVTVREILARALTAPRGAEWVCDKCGSIHAQWVPICASCAGFDTLTWRDPDPLHSTRTAGSEIDALLFAATPPERQILELSPPEEVPEPPKPAPAVEDVPEAEIAGPPAVEEDIEEALHERPDEILRRSS